MATATYNGGNVTHTSPANVTWNSRLTVTTTEYPTHVVVSYTGIFYVHGSAAPYLVANRMTATLTVAGANVKTYTGPSSQTTYKGATTVLSYSATYQKTTTAQNKACSFKITVGSASSWSGTSTATVTGGITIPALASYTVDYNANGGSGSISSQTKYYSITLPLSDGTGFSRANHSLTGWNTASDGSGTQYEPAGSFTDNADTTLYATWHLDYILASVSNLAIYRVASAGSTTESDSGERIHVGFDYVGGSLDGGTTKVKPTVKIEIDGSTVYDTQQSTATGTFSSDYGTYSKDTTHEVEVTVYDANDPTGQVFEAEISTATYPIDLIGSGTNVYMGIMVPAESGQPLKLMEFKTENMFIDLPDYQTAGTTDKEIYDALVDLGWDSEVIV